MKNKSTVIPLKFFPPLHRVAPCATTHHTNPSVWFIKPHNESFLSRKDQRCRTAGTTYSCEQSVCRRSPRLAHLAETTSGVGSKRSSACPDTSSASARMVLAGEYGGFCATLGGSAFSFEQPSQPYVSGLPALAFALYLTATPVCCAIIAEGMVTASVDRCGMVSFVACMRGLLRDLQVQAKMDGCTMEDFPTLG